MIGPFVMGRFVMGPFVMGPFVAGVLLCLGPSVKGPFFDPMPTASWMPIGLMGFGS